MKILCVVGMPGSGKTIVSDKAKQLGLFTLTIDEIIREELQRRGMLYTWKNERRVDEWFHENPRELMRRIVNKITGTKNQDKIVIEGLSSSEQFNHLRERIQNSYFSIFAVHTPPELRWKWEKDRRDYHIGGYIEAKQRDRIQTERGTPELIAMADHMIINDGDLMEFRKTVKDKLIDILNIDVKR